MRALRHSLWILLLLMTACAQSRDLARHEAAGKGAAGAEKGALWAPCTPDQALMWERQSKQDPEAPLRAARCYAVLARHGKSKAIRLENAVKGRRLAEEALSREPNNGTAHYLAAYLTGLEAQNDALKGLALVPVIRANAAEAARLKPQLDHGGPDRMLGELYLKAPDPPVSIGDLEKAISHYRRAVSQDPDFVQNRLGLAEAYLEDEDPGPACRQIQEILTRIPPADKWEEPWKQSLDLLKRVCEMEK